MSSRHCTTSAGHELMHKSKCNVQMRAYVLQALCTHMIIGSLLLAFILVLSPLVAGVKSASGSDAVHALQQLGGRGVG